VQTFLLLIDRVNTWVGKTFAWAIVLLTIQVTYEVMMRYLFNSPTNWGFDASYMLYGALFMMAGAYTLARNGHVRGDFLYRNFGVRGQAWMDLILYFLFFFPAIFAFIYYGYSFARLSWLINEHSMFSPAGLLIWPFKALIPVAGILLLLQGVAEVIRCVIAIRTGRWPDRLHDVEETERIILEHANKAAAGEEAVR